MNCTIYIYIYIYIIYVKLCVYINTGFIQMYIYIYIYIYTSVWTLYLCSCIHMILCVCVVSECWVKNVFCICIGGFLCPSRNRLDRLAKSLGKFQWQTRLSLLKWHLPQTGLSSSRTENWHLHYVERKKRRQTYKLTHKYIFKSR